MSETREPIRQQRILLGSKGIPFLQGQKGELLFDTLPRGLHKLAGVKLQTTSTEIFTLDKDYDPLLLIVSNAETGVDHTFSLYHVRPGESVGVDTLISNLLQALTFTDGPSQWQAIGGRAGDVLYGTCDVNDKVVAALYGALAQ